MCYMKFSRPRFGTATLLAILYLAIQTTLLNAEIFPSGRTREVSIIQGSQVNIQWTNHLRATMVDLELWNGDTQTLTTIARGVSAHTKLYSWVVPTYIPNGSRYRFVIRDASNKNRAEFSECFVQIGEAPFSVTSVQENNAESPLHVFPNPASVSCEVRWSGVRATSIIVEDIQGKLIGRYAVQSTATSMLLDITGYGSGVYKVTVFNNQERVGSESMYVVP